MIAATEINEMSFTERLQTMELLWKSIAPFPEKVPSPVWHGEVLASRLAKVEAGEGTFLSIDELKARLRGDKP